MQVVILAGGMGTRLAEETSIRPKPMVEIGGMPILWHIMNIYAAHGFREFIVACGYKADVIKDYFHRFFVHFSDIIVELKDGTIETASTSAPDWRVSLIDTAMNTMTGGRIKRLSPHLGGQPFMVTYGDGVGDINVSRLLEFHRSHGRLATVTAVRPPARFGGLVIRDGQVTEFSEKPQSEEGWINGGFFVFEPGVLNYIEGDQAILERAPLEALALDGQLMAYRHEGFWQPMDTLREKHLLESLWATGNAPWKVW